jgi:hypothetical protein
MADLNDFHHPGVGLAGFTLSFTTLLRLQQKGVLSQLDVIEIVEHALLNLETHEIEGSPQSQEATQFARALLEQLRTLISPEGS